MFERSFSLKWTRNINNKSLIKYQTLTEIAFGYVVVVFIISKMFLLKIEASFSLMFDVFGNKAKRRTSKRVFEENKSRQIFRKRTFLTSWYAHARCVSGGKKCLFFGKFGVLCFLETTVLRFVLLPCYRRLKDPVFLDTQSFQNFILADTILPQCF